MSTVSLNVKINSDLKSALVYQAENLGVSLSSFVNLALTQISKQKEIVINPSEALTPADEPSPKLARILKKAQKEIERGETYGPFTPAESKEFLNNLMS